MKRKLLICQHVPFELLGTLNPLLKKAGFRLKYVNFGRDPFLKPNLDGYSGVVLLGGPMNVDQEDQYPHLATEVTLIQEAIKRDLPVLGICLGAQLVAKALGAKVSQNPMKEIGWYDVKVTDEGLKDPVFAHFKKSEKIFQWHGDTFDIPEAAVRLASTDTCPNQAFRYKNNVYGFQFHMEVDQKLIKRWLRQPAYKKEVQELEAKGQTNIKKILIETQAYVDELEALSKQSFSKYIDLFGIEKKATLLKSR